MEVIEEMRHRLTNDNIAVVAGKGVTKLLITQCQHLIRVPISKGINQVLCNVRYVQLIDNDMFDNMVREHSISTPDICHHTWIRGSVLLRVIGQLPDDTGMDAVIYQPVTH